MTINDEIARRGITEVLHFTTNNGLVGILRSGGVLSRDRLPNEAQLEFIFRANAEYRRDVAWLDYVNLSVSKINRSFFQVAVNRWHRNRMDIVFWCILSFDPVIMSHGGVYFTTTNNFYPSVLRSQGLRGFQSMFAPTVSGRYASAINRGDIEEKFTTCEQAEVLYPGMVPIEFLRRIYVANSDDGHDIAGAFAGVLSASREQPIVEVRPELF